MKIAVLGVNLGKNVCSSVGFDEVGAVVLRRRSRRDTLIDCVGKLPPCIVAMEACCGAHHLGRLFAAQGHDVRLMSPEYVRPYVKAQKNDDRDAAGIAEAATRPTMRFVETKTEAQLDMQTRHRSRDRLGGERTALINQLRAILLERGIVVPQGKRKLEQYLVMLMEEEEGRGRSARIRMRSADMRAQWLDLDRRIASFEAEFTSFARVHVLCERKRSRPAIDYYPGRRRHDRGGVDRGDWQSRDFRARSRSGGVARPRSASIDNRRQTAPHGHQQARQHVSLKAVDPWRTGSVALCRRAGHGSRRRRPQLGNTQTLGCNLNCRHAARSANQRHAASSHVCDVWESPRNQVLGRVV